MLAVSPVSKKFVYYFGSDIGSQASNTGLAVGGYAMYIPGPKINLFIRIGVANADFRHEVLTDEAHA